MISVFWRILRWIATDHDLVCPKVLRLRVRPLGIHQHRLRPEFVARLPDGFLNAVCKKRFQSHGSQVFFQALLTAERLLRHNAQRSNPVSRRYFVMG